MAELEKEAKQRTEEINEDIKELRKWYKEKNAEAREKSGVDEAYNHMAEPFDNVDSQPIIDDVDVEAELSDADIEGPVNDTTLPPLFNSGRTLGQQLDVIRLYSPNYDTIETEEAD